MNDIRKAILQAADHIEAHPGQFNFHHPEIPRCCASPGCALGWIHFFAEPETTSMWTQAGVIDAKVTLGIADVDFYYRMELLVEEWMGNAQACAMGLRLYADEYYPVPVWAAMRDREEKNGTAGFNRFRKALVLVPRTILPSEVSEEVAS